MMPLPDPRHAHSSADPVEPIGLVGRVAASDFARVEQRVGDATLRADAGGSTRSGSPGTLTGVAIRYNSLSLPIAGMFRERVMPGALRKTLAGLDGDVYAFWQHDSSRPLARVSNRTLRLRDSGEGLVVAIDVPAMSWGTDAAEAVRAGLVDKMSFGFMVRAERMSKERSDDNYPIRELLDIELFEVSPVTMPAYEATSLKGA